jgi:hypothetical protein
MKEYNVKQYPITLTGMGGGVGALRYNFASGSGVDVQTTTNAPLNIGSPFTRNNGNYFTYMEFQSSGSVLLLQHLWGEWKYNLSTPYDVSASSMSYQANSARYWTICGYKNNAMSSYKQYARVMRFDYDNDSASFYGGDGTTKIVENLDVYTQLTPTDTSSSSSPFGSLNYWDVSCQTYIKKSGGGIAYMQITYGKKIYLRNYANSTTSTVSSYSTLDYSGLGLDLSNYGIRMGFMSANGTTISIYTQRNSNTSYYDIHKWTLSTPFDLSTAGSVTSTNNNNSSIYWNERGTIVNDGNGKAVGWDQYGTLYSYSYTTDGDLNTLTRPSQLDRTANGAYHNGSSYVAYCDDGKKVIDMGYSSSHYVYDSTSNPYGWQFHDGGFGNNRSSNRTSVYTSSTNEGQTFSDGRFNADRSKLYSSFYSSTYRVTERNLSTPGDISTLSGSYSGHNSETTFSGFTGSYWSHSAWYDKLNNKFHLAGHGSSDTYFIFNLDADGEFDGTWNSTPTGFSTGDFSGMNHLQPLSHNGKYFTYFDTGQQDCYILELNYPFEPARGYTQVKKFDVEFNLPNGTKRQDSSYSRMYVSGGRIFFANYYDTNITAVVDVTIDGRVPDDIIDNGWPYDLDNMTFTGKAPNYRWRAQTTQDTHGVYLKPDGTVLYIFSADKKIRRHNLSTAYDLGTASYDSVSTTLTGVASGGLFFKSDGTKVFYIDDMTVRAYTLSTAWDISSVSIASDTLSLSSFSNGPSSLSFKPDGSKIYVSENAYGNSYIHQWSLSTSWDLSTASSGNSSPIFSGSQQDKILGFSWKADGTQIIVTHGSYYIARWPVSTAWDISTRGSQTSVGGFYQVVEGMTGLGMNIQWKSDGTVAFVPYKHQTMAQLEPSSAWTLSSVSNDTPGDEAEYVKWHTRRGGSSTYCNNWSSDGLYWYQVGGSSTIYKHAATTAFDLKTVSNSYTYGTLTGTGYGTYDFKFNSDGTVLLVINTYTAKKAFQYSLSTGFDLSTISSSYTDLDLTSGSGSNNFTGGCISDDGKYIYMNQGTNIYQWTLSTPFSLSSASYTRSQSGFATAGWDSMCKISPDGTQLITHNNQYSPGYNVFNSYELTTAWDISTKVHQKTVNLHDKVPHAPILVHSAGWTIANKSWYFNPYYNYCSLQIDFT